MSALHLAPSRARSVTSVADELEYLCGRYPRPYVIFRDPLFTKDRDRCLALCHEILNRHLHLRFECETRLDRLDEGLLTLLHRTGLRALSFGVESVDTNTLRKAGRRPIPQAHQQAIVDFCAALGVVTAAFYVFGFLQDTWASIASTIDYAIQLGSTFAQFKILTPYPGTPLWKQMQPLVYEQDWEQFDGFTPTFHHPNMTADELMFLLGAAYSRFYVRPTFFANHLGIRSVAVRQMVGRLDAARLERHSRRSSPASQDSLVLTAISVTGSVPRRTSTRSFGGVERGQLVQGRHRASSRLKPPRPERPSPRRRTHGLLPSSSTRAGRIGNHHAGAHLLGDPRTGRAAGLRPVFADVIGDFTPILPRSNVRSRRTRRRRADASLRSAAMDAIMAIARRHNLAVIEDCAHALERCGRRPVAHSVTRRYSAFRR